MKVLQFQFIAYLYCTNNNNMTKTTYCREFSNYDDAFDFQNNFNMKLRKQGIKSDWLNVVPGPDGNYSVVDDITAIELGMGYVFTASSTAFVANPWA